MYRGRGGGHHPGTVMAKVKLRVPRLVNVGPGARLNLEKRKILLDRGVDRVKPKEKYWTLENERDFVLKAIVGL